MTMSKRLRKQKAQKILESSFNQYLSEMTYDELRVRRDSLKQRSKSGISHVKDELDKVEKELLKRKK